MGQVFEIYTDGGCSGNPGPGGWAYVLRTGDRTERDSGGERDTTNNRMELTAVIQALTRVSGMQDGERPSVDVYTDSVYVQKGMTSWLSGWVRNGWRTSGKQPVKNRDLWQELSRISESMVVRWHWVRGHAGNESNEACDAMVQEQIKALR